jgi:hypothetical protein
MDPDELTAEVQWCQDLNVPSSLQVIPEAEVPALNQYIPVDIRRQDGTVADIVCVELSFVPCYAGIHLMFVKWRGDDVTGSPFCRS